jgi:ACR3 family arsenite transporter
MSHAAISGKPDQATGLGTFERYLSLWVALCMGAGLVLGKTLPSMIGGLRGLELGRGSQVNVPIAVLIWLMITPMMMKVDFQAVRNVGRNPGGLLVTLFVNSTGRSDLIFETRLPVDEGEDWNQVLQNAELGSNWPCQIASQ